MAGEREVRGMVRGLSDTDGLRVHAVARALRRDRPLADAALDPDGRYRIAYALPAPVRGGRARVDLRVRVTNRAGEVLAESPITFNAKPREIINLEVRAPDQGSEYERYLEALKPSLGDLVLSNLTDEDIDLLTRQTDVPQLSIARLSAATEAEQETGVPAAFFYGLFTLGQPTDLTALTLVPSRRLLDTLERALAAQLVPSSLKPRAKAHATRIAGLAPEKLASNPDARPLMSVATTARLTAAERDAFLRAVGDADGDEADDVWQRLGNAVPKEKMEALRGAVHVAALSGGHPALVEALTAKKAGSPEGLARLGVTGLSAAIAAIPELINELPGEDGDPPDTKALGLANAIIDHLEDAAPSVVARVALEATPIDRLDGVLRRDVLAALSRGADFDLRRGNVDRWIRETPAVLDGASDAEAVRRELKRIQRTLRLVPRFADAAALMDEGFDSAHHIAREPESAFVARFAARLGGEEQARDTHARARAVSDMANAATTMLIQSVRDVAMAAVTPDRGRVKAEILQRLPNLAVLFGNQSSCACTHCRSVLSPAAYLVDLFQFLGRAGRQELLGERPRPGRRPDLAHLPLSCENTNTAIPYIDLVNEILEYQVVHGRIDRGAAHDTGSRTAEDLRAEPAFVEQGAYAQLAETVYPPRLPFNRPLAITRRYLDHLGTSVAEIRRTFAPHGEPDEDAVAAATLGLDDLERKILLGTSGKPLNAFYGGRSAAQLRTLEIFLAATGMTLDELQPLLACRFVNPTGALRLELSAQCDPAASRIEGLDADHLDRIHRFLRLARKLGWEVRELDHACTAFASTTVDAALLQKLAAVTELRTRLPLRPPQALWSLWADLSWRGDDAPYAQLFLRRDASVDPAFERPAAGAPLSDSSKRLHQHTGALTAAFRISGDELSAIRAALALDGEEAALSLANVSRIYRVVVLARSLRLKVTDLFGFITLTGIDPFAAPASTLELITALEQVRASASTLDQIQHLLRHVVPPNRLAPEGPDRSAVFALAGALRDLDSQIQLTANTGDLRALLGQLLPPDAVEVIASLVAGTSQAPSDEQRRRLRDALQAMVDDVATFEEALVDRASRQDGAPVFVDENGEPRPAADAVMTAAEWKSRFVQVRLVPPLRDRRARELITHALVQGVGLTAARARDLSTGLLRSVLDAAQPLEQDWLALREVASSDSASGWNGWLIVPDAAEYRFIVRASGHVRLAVGGIALIDGIVSGESVSPGTTLQAGEAYWVSLETADAGAVLLWQSPSRPSEPIPLERIISEHAAARALRAWGRVSKVVTLASSLRLTDEELAHVISRHEETGGLDWSALPLERSEATAAAIDLGAPTQFRAWQQLEQYARLRGSLPAAETALVSVLQAPDVETARARLLAATGWDAETVGALSGEMGFNLTSADFQRFATLTRLARAVALAARMGVDGATLFTWASEGPTDASVDRLKWALKSRHDDEDWSRIAQSLNEPLREQQRDALVALLLDRLNLPNSNALFQRLLIDVDMAACQETSRVRAAIASVQLFVQRILLNLEPDVPPSAIDAEEWEWMKAYRVWEANRKIFLWPENWIEPQLRDDASPFFRELESELLQGELTEAAAERAFLGYVQKLHQVARLQVCGVCEDESDGTLHVIGRTFDTPHVYFHRQRVRGQWTPWDRIDMDIEGDHVVPHAQDRRLYVFWLHFEERQDQHQQLRSERIESYDHWRWRTQLIPAWEPEHEAWRAAHQTWKEHRDFVTALRSGLQTLNRSLPEEHQIDVDAVIDEYVAGHPEAGAAEPFEPRPPQEPPYSLSDPMKHQRVQLCWTHYKDGIWSSKETSEGALQSPMIVRTLSGLAEAHANPLFAGLALAALDLGPGGAIATQFLPAASDHFVRLHRLDSGGRIAIDVSRRYQWKVPLADIWWETNGSDYVGRFTVRCGSQAVAATSVQARDFDDLPRPKGATNQANLLRGSSNLVFESGSKDYPILQAIPDGTWDLAHQAGIDGMATAPPFERFALNDRNRTFLAEPPQPLRVQAAASALTVGVTRDRAKVALKRGAMSRVSAKQVGSFGTGSSVAALAKGLRFETFYHPHACAFLDTLYAGGVPALLARSTQRRSLDPASGNQFTTLYQPTGWVSLPRPRADVDFDADGAYASYNWELFFHVPLRVAIALSQQHRFEEAQRWFHFVFNPTTSSREPSPQRYWNFLPFFRNLQPEHEDVRALLDALADGDPGGKVARQIAAWRDDPFNPHLIARMRITAYQKHVAVAYIDHLVSWGDTLFQRDTAEAVAEAALLYVLAAELLGPRPIQLPREEGEPRSYAELQQDLDAFSNALIEFEEQDVFAWQAIEPVAAGRTNARGQARRTALSSSIRTRFRRVSGRAVTKASAGRLTAGRGVVKGLRAVETVNAVPYFCVPRNDKLLQRWDIVSDRLFKIRHCMNIGGTSRQLALFDPPIDPALLVRARAAGVDLGSAVADLHAPLPQYRFPLLLQKAQELCQEVKALGAALLGALEKRDAETLAALRTAHESSLLRAMRQVRRLQIDNARATREGLVRSRGVAETRRDYYRDIEQISAAELEHLDQLGTAHTLQQVSHGLSASVAGAFGIPHFDVGSAGWAATPIAKVGYGGQHLGSALKAVAEYIAMLAAHHSHQAAMASIKAEYDRRWEEWKFQEHVAEREITQIDQQIAAADLQIAISERELVNHDQHVAQSLEMEALLRSKVTNEGLYDWMAAETSQLYFQAYKLAYDLAKRSERAFRFERGGEAAFIGFGHWDGVRKGLLAGERLSLDLRRMETAYLEQHRREFEITKHVSLVLLDPLALIALKETGRCEIHLPESLFDADFPGHYMRRVKHVSLSVPCIVGPYTSVNATLTLLSSEVRIDPKAGGDYARAVDGDDDRFISDFAPVQSIATSHAQNDSGLFELNFRDERYLPFEGAGAVSRWRLELPKETNAFDRSTVTDAILHFRYTARDGGDALRAKALAAYTEALASDAGRLQTRFVSLRHEFPDAWYQLLHPQANAAPRAEVSLARERFPTRFRGRTLRITRLDAYVRFKDLIPASGGDTFAVVARDATINGSIVPPGESARALTFARGALSGDVLHAAQEVDMLVGSPSAWALTFDRTSIASLDDRLRGPDGGLRPEAVDDVFVVLHYTVA